VAVKTKVGAKSQIDPRPGMREVQSGLPGGAAFDGHVQAMGFRFRTEHLVVPMRLSAFNEGDLHNVVYLVTEGPRKIRAIPEEYVVRQVSGAELLSNVTQPLPLRILGGLEAQIPPWQRESLPRQRDPAPHNAHAKDLLAADLLAVKADRLSHPHEEAEKALLRIGEHFGLRGPEIDAHNADVLAADRAAATRAALDDVRGLTLSVIDGDFPREVLAGKNLSFAEYRMPARRNSADFYDAKLKKPAGPRAGLLHLGQLSDPPNRGDLPRTLARWSLLGSAAIGLALLWRRRGSGRRHAAPAP
jgi:hypothetical protein